MPRCVPRSSPGDVAERQYWTNQFLYAGAKEADVMRRFRTSAQYLPNYRGEARLATVWNVGLLAGTATDTQLAAWTGRLAALDTARVAVKDQTSATVSAYEASLAATLGRLDDETAQTGVRCDILNSDQYAERALDSFYSAFDRQVATTAAQEALRNDRDAAGHPLDLGTLAAKILAAPLYRAQAEAQEG